MTAEKTTLTDDPQLPPEVQESINSYALYYAEHHKLGMSVRDDMTYIAQLAIRWAPKESAAPSTQAVEWARKVAMNSIGYSTEQVHAADEFLRLHKLRTLRDSLPETVAVPRWLPASTPPALGITVVFIDSEGVVSTGRREIFNKGEAWISDSDVDRMPHTGVTHWMDVAALAASRWKESQ